MPDVARSLTTALQGAAHRCTCSADESKVTQPGSERAGIWGFSRDLSIIDLLFSSIVVRTFSVGFSSFEIYGDLFYGSACGLSL